MAARILQQNLPKCDWSALSKASLQAMSADAKQNLEHIPDTYKASEISSFFTGRPDWGLFASVFPCLWGEVAENLSTDDDRALALKLVKSKDFLRVVQRFRQTEGIAPHPAVAYRITFDEPTEAKLKVSPRASAPRMKRKASAGGTCDPVSERPSTSKRRARRPVSGGDGRTARSPASSMTLRSVH